jgi:hypothetical protein
MTRLKPNQHHFSFTRELRERFRAHAAQRRHCIPQYFRDFGDGISLRENTAKTRSD